MATIGNPPSNKSIFQFPPNFPSGQVSDAWMAWFQEVKANTYDYPSPVPGYALGWDNDGNIVNVPNTGADQYADLANYADPAKGAGRVGHSNALAYAANTVGKAIQDRVLSSDLADAATDTKGAGAVGYGDAVAYASDTVGDWIRTKLTKVSALIASGGSALVGFLQAGTGAVARTVQDKLQERVSAFDFMTTAQIADVQARAETLDVAAALQAAIDYCIGSGRRLWLPAGTYKITAPLRIMRFSGGAYSFCSFTAEGEVMAWSTAGTGLTSVIIKPSFNDRPALAIQTVRAVTLKNIAVVGTNDVQTYVAADYARMMLAASFNRDSSRDQRYSPYCGIAIDPFGTSVPADGGYPGMSSYYAASAAGSSFVSLENLNIKNFIVGIAITPNGQTPNAENIYLDKCLINYNKAGLSIGQSQSRNVVVRGCNVAFNYYCFDSATYGARTGTTPTILGANCAGKYLFNVGSTSGMPGVIVGLYAEAFAAIGFFGANANGQNPITFRGCSFNFNDWSGAGPHPDHHVVAYGPMKFDGCTFATSGQTYPGPIRVWHHQGAPVTFDTCNFNFGTTLLELLIAPTTGTNGVEWEGLHFANCGVQEGSRGNNAGRSVISSDLLTYDLSLNFGGLAYAPQNGRVKLSTVASPYFCTHLTSDNKVSLGALTVTIGSNGKATFTVADAAVVRVGDLVYATDAFTAEGPLGTGTFSTAMTPIGVISGIIGSDVTINGVPQNLATGSYTLFVEWISRYHLASTGDTTSGNASILNVTNPTTWKVGHRIKGAGIPAGSVITNVSGTTVTISKNATATAAGVRLYDANVYQVTGTAV